MSPAALPPAVLSPYALSRTAARARTRRPGRRAAALSLALLAGGLAYPGTARAGDPALQGEAMSLPSASGQAFADPAAQGGAGLLLWTDGTATGTVSPTGTAALTVRARGDQCQGAPSMTVAVDGRDVATVAVAAAAWQDYPVPGALVPGPHRVAVSFRGDYRDGTCDRNLRLDAITPVAVPGRVEAETLPLSLGAGQPFADSTASGGAGLLVWTNGTAGTTLAGPAGGRIVVRARGDLCAGAPTMAVSLDGQPVATVGVGAQVWQDYPVGPSWPGGAHRVDVAYTDDLAASGCDRNLRLDSIAVAATAVSPLPQPPVLLTGGSPFTGTHGYVDPQSPAAAAAAARRSWDPVGAAALDRVAGSPKADWFGDWNATSSLASTVSARLGTESAAGALPVLVAYAIPHRDCGSWSGGGQPTGDAYRAWIAQLAAGIGARRAVVVLEPDALAQLDCLSAADQAERTSLIAGAVGALTALPATSVYLDAGNADWHPPAEMAARLTAAGVARTRGFTLNVSNFGTDAVNQAYGDALSGLLGGKHFLVDSSRNGLGPGSTWCNPPGRALGRSTAVTSDPLLDALLWIKAPGESDGTCNGGPPAGQFWVDYAIGLAQRAA